MSGHGASAPKGVVTRLVQATALFVIFAVEIAIHLVLRHQKVGLGDLSKQFNNWLHSFGSKKPKEAKAGQVQLFGSKGDVVEVPENDAPERAGYDAVQEIFTQPLKLNAERIEMQPHGVVSDAQNLAQLLDRVRFAPQLGHNLAAGRRKKTGIYVHVI